MKNIKFIIMDITQQLGVYLGHDNVITGTIVRKGSGLIKTNLSNLHEKIIIVVMININGTWKNVLSVTRGGNIKRTYENRRVLTRNTILIIVLLN